jgi:hypothetical protein
MATWSLLTALLIPKPSVVLHQVNGNLVITDSSSNLVWQTNTAGQPTCFLWMQGDCNFVLYKWVLARYVYDRFVCHAAYAVLS